MKALTIHQPYAHLIAAGEKWVENRTWQTRYRGLLAIHAGTSRERLSSDDTARNPNMVFGAIVAVCRLAGCKSLDVLKRERYDVTSLYILDHPHTEGPYCWVLADAVRLSAPIPMAGKQGLWRLPGEIVWKLEREFESCKALA